MESHISHDLAKVFTRDPKAYSTQNLEKHLKLTDLALNNFDIRKLYLYQASNFEFIKSNYALESYSPVEDLYRDKRYQWLHDLAHPVLTVI